MDNDQCLAIYTTANAPTHQCCQRAAAPAYQFCSRHVALVRQYVLNGILDTTPILTLMVSEDGSFIKQIEFGDEMEQDGYISNEGRDADELSVEEGYSDDSGPCDDPDCDDPFCVQRFDYDDDDPHATPRRYAYEDRESDWSGSAGSVRRNRDGRDGGNDSQMSDRYALPRYPPARRGNARNPVYSDRHNGRDEENRRDRESFTSASSRSFDSSSLESFDSSSSEDSSGSASSSGSDSDRRRHPRQRHGSHPDNNHAHADTPDYDSEYTSHDDAPPPATHPDNENYPPPYPFYPYPYARGRGPTSNGGSRYRLGSARDAYARRRSRSPVGDGYRGNGWGERRRPPSVDLGYRRYA